MIQPNRKTDETSGPNPFQVFSDEEFAHLCAHAVGFFRGLQDCPRGELAPSAQTACLGLVMHMMATTLNVPHEEGVTRIQALLNAVIEGTKKMNIQFLEIPPSIEEMDA